MGGLEPKYGYFVQGSIIGLQLDADRGMLNFYKDGEDLGPAFVTGELRIGNYYPFFRIRTKSRLSIFSPKQYPWYFEVPVEPVMPQEPTLDEDFFYTEIAEEERKRLEREAGENDRPSLYGIDIGENFDEIDEEATVIVPQEQHSRFLYEAEPDPAEEARLLKLMEESFERRFDMRNSNRFHMDITRAGIHDQRESVRYRRSLKTRHEDLHLDAHTRHLIKDRQRLQESQIFTSKKLKDAYLEEDPQLEQNRSDIVTPEEEQYRIGRMDARPPHVQN